MPVITVKRKLSGSTNGRGIKVVQTATAGDTIHTAVSGTTDGCYDEIYLYAYNGHSAAVNLTIEFGGATVPDDNIVVGLASKSGLSLIVPGLILQNSVVVKAFASTGNVVVITGFVNRITET
jgi:hypothetical protein